MKTWYSKRVRYSPRAYTAMIATIDWCARQLPCGGMSALMFGRRGLRFELLFELRPSPALRGLVTGLPKRRVQA